MTTAVETTSTTSTTFPRPFHTQIVFEAVTAIAHHAGVEGNHSVQMTSKQRLADGTFGKLPCITADTLRHMLRHVSSKYLVESCGLTGKLSVEAMRLLFQGGMLTGKGDGSKIKLDTFRELERTVPTLSLLGGCVHGMMIPGRLQVEEGMLICKESLHKIPSWMVEYLTQEKKYEIPSYRAQTDELQRVRMDVTMVPEVAHLLSEAGRKQITGRVEARNEAHDSGDAVAAAAAKSTMLPRTFDVVCAGACFSWELRGIFHNDLEEAAFYSTIALLLTSDLAIGGKKGTGHGRIKLLKAGNELLPTPQAALQQIDCKALQQHVLTRYDQHLRDNGAKIRDFLSTVDA